MAGFCGGDTEQMRDQAQACELGSQRIQDLAETINCLVDSVPWLGPDAIAFRAMWHGTVKPGMITKAEDVRARGQELSEHATEQDRVSGPTDIEGLIDVIGDVVGDLLPVPSVPGLPLTPDVLERFRKGLGDWFSGGDADGEQYMYGAGDDFGVGQVAADGRPIGPYDAGGSHWDGREIDNGFGYLDAYAHTRASAGAHVTKDEFGNYTGTVGARAGAEIGIEEVIYGPDGEPLFTGKARAGAEAYAEAGGTIGPDGLSAGARAGAGVYGDASVRLDGPYGKSMELGMEGYAGAHAEANAYANLTRNDSGQVNGVQWGAKAEAMAGAEGKMTFEESSPGGWFSAKGSAGGNYGAAAGASTGGSISTDEISFGVGGKVALGGGATGDLTVSIHPNQIVDTFTPGDYNIDDAVADSGAFVGDVAEATSKYSPFW